MTQRPYCPPSTNSLTHDDLRLYQRVKSLLSPGAFPSLPPLPRWKLPVIQLPHGEVLLPDAGGGDRRLVLAKGGDIKIVGANINASANANANVNSTDTKFKEQGERTRLVGEIYLTNKAQNVLLKNLTLTNRTGTGLKVDANSQALLANVTIAKCCLSGIHCTGPKSTVTLLKSKLDSNGRHGICVRMGAMCYLQSTDVVKNRSDGIAGFDEGTEIHVQYCDIAGLGKVSENAGAGISSRSNSLTYIHLKNNHRTAERVTDLQSELNLIGTKCIFTPLPMDGLGCVVLHNKRLGTKRKR